MSKFKLPEPSGEVSWDGQIQNSYGTRGIYRVGRSEVENPIDDVEYHAQALADALAALAFEDEKQNSRVDSLAALARDTYYGLNEDGLRGWPTLSDEFKDRWRQAVRVVLLHAGLVPTDER